MSDAYYCKECTLTEKDVSTSCLYSLEPKISGTYRKQMIINRFRNLDSVVCHHCVGIQRPTDDDILIPILLISLWQGPLCTTGL